MERYSKFAPIIVNCSETKTIYIDDVVGCIVKFKKTVAQQLLFIKEVKLLMSHYVFAPAGKQKTQSELIYRCVEYIGESQAGGGSNFAKGKRYLKSKIPHCSGRAIKRTISTFSKVVGNDFETYGCDVYYYHIVLCHKIVYAIIDYIKTYSNDQWKKDTFGHIPKESEYCNLIYQHRISQLRWVQHMDYMEQGERAAEVLGHFS